MTIRNSFIKEDVLLKIVGYSALIIVSIVGWALVTLYNMNGTVNSINVNVSNVKETVDRNYVILQGKADEKENKAAHDFLINQVGTLEKKIDRNYDRRIRYGVVPKVDSVKYMLMANSNKLDTIKSYTAEIKEILTVNQVHGVPYKEINTYVENFNLH